MYSDKVMDHFQNPRNVGSLDDADGIGKVGNPVCGDMMEFYIKVKDNILTDVKFKTFGCGAAIAVSSMVSEMAIGKSVEEALKITNSDVAEELDGLPKNKLHCSNLGADALHMAIESFQNREDSEESPTPVVAEEAEHEECTCPYCEGPVEETSDICQSCHIELEDCPECGKARNKNSEECLHCGATRSPAK